jgi:two-component system response regulator YesN
MLDGTGLDIDIFTAANGAETLEEVRNKKFDLVILDRKTPKINGLTLLLEAINGKYLSPESIILLSGDLHPADVQTVQTAKELSIKNISPKPFSGPDLLNMVNSILSKIEN